MRIQTIISAAALSIALGFTGAAFAQTSIGGQTISEADQEVVKNHCEDLKLADSQAVQGSEDTKPVPETDNDNEKTDEPDTTAVDGVDLNMITLADCIEAGFVTQ